MGRNIANVKIDKNFILSKVSQITIFATYLDISDKTIINCIETGALIKSPLRNDMHPTCGFRYDKKGKLKFRDFAGYFWGDCFDLVAYIMNSIYEEKIDINNKKDFIRVLRHITFVFKDIFYGGKKDINLINDINVSLDTIKNTKNVIELVTRTWEEDDINYWKQFGIGLQDLNINFVYPIDQFYINRKINPNPKYYYNVDDPCYAYLLGVDRQGILNIKLYFPKRKKLYTRFICNYNHLEGIYQLDKTDYDYIIITKSTKDRIAMSCAMKGYNSLYGVGTKYNIGFINIPHETYRLRTNEYSWLISKLKKNGMLVSLMDNDKTGKVEAIWLKHNYNITPILIDKKYNAKDFSELVSKNETKVINDLIHNTLKYLDNDKTIRDIRLKEENSSLPFT